MPPRNTKGLRIVVCIVAMSIIISAMMLLLLSSTDTMQEIPTQQKELKKTLLVPDVPKRIPVAGVDGYEIVVYKDGSSYIEGPEGKKTQLTAPAIPDIESKIERKLQTIKPKRTALGQLIVTDLGVVDVPNDAVITFIGRDKVVTHDQDGTSVTYYVNGRIERHVRGDRLGN